MRSMGLYLFASAKGGVGKSALAVLTAKLLAGLGRKPVVIDADVMGSSLADGLSLRAPVVVETDGVPDYSAAPTGQWHDLATTRALRERRKQWWAAPVRGPQLFAPAPVYLNDALLYPGAEGPQDCRVDAMLWRAVGEDEERYLPSSPLRREAARIAPYVSGSHAHFAWVRRIAWIIDALVSHDETITDLVLDLPPGTWGISHEAFVLARKIEEPLPTGFPQWHERLRWRAMPTVVTTPDRNDRMLAIEYWLETRHELPSLALLVNRVSEPEPGIRASIREDLPEMLRQRGIEEEVRIVPSLPGSLGRLFVDGRLHIDAEHRKLMGSLRIDLGERTDG